MIQQCSEVEKNRLEDNITVLNPFNLEPVDAPPPSLASKNHSCLQGC